VWESWWGTTRKGGEKREGPGTGSEIGVSGGSHQNFWKERRGGKGSTSDIAFGLGADSLSAKRAEAQVERKNEKNY